MADTEGIYANPERIQQLAEDLLMFTNSLHANSVEIENALNNLGRSWRDPDFEKFRHFCGRLKDSLAELAKDVRKREPELRGDAEALIQLLKLQQS
jgi:hypothetical protein